MMASADARSVKNRAAIILALGNLSAELARTRSLRELLNVRLRPVRGVFMAKAAAVGAVVIPPETLSVKATSPEAEPPAGALEVRMDPADPAFRYWLLPSQDKVCVPYWFLRGSSDRAEVNTSLEVFRITMLVGQDYDGAIDLSADMQPAEQPAAAPLRRISHKTGEKAGAAAIREKETPPAAAITQKEKPAAAAVPDQYLYISIPVLVNSVPVAEGAELRHYVAPPVKRPREAAALTLEKVARRRA